MFNNNFDQTLNIDKLVSILLNYKLKVTAENKIHYVKF